MNDFSEYLATIEPEPAQTASLRADRRICGGIKLTCCSQGKVRLQRPHGLHTQPSEVREAIMNVALTINFVALIFGHVVPTAVTQRFS